MQITFAYQILNLDFSNTSEGVTIFTRLGHTVAKEAVDSLQRFPLSAVSHNDCKSFIKGLHPKNRSTELILYSDGSLEVDQQNKLLDDASMVVLNVNDLENIEYSNGRYKYRIIYQTLGLISLLSTFIVLFILLDAWYDAMYLDETLTDTELVATLAPLIWIFFDLYRGKLAKPAKIVFKLSNGTTKEVTGKLPDSDSYSVSVIIMMTCVILYIIASISWGIDNLPLVGDVVGIILLLMFLLGPLWLIINYFKSEKSLSGIESYDIPNGLMHLYFASLTIFQNRRMLQNQESKLESAEIEELRNKLMKHEEVISSIMSANFIFDAPSPSLGLIAIRVSTEAIMKNCCELKDLHWKPNARITLRTYLERYRKEHEMDSKIESNIKSIIELGNRAAHDFNIDWDEFRLAANQFCDIVIWYSALQTSKPD